MIAPLLDLGHRLTLILPCKQATLVRVSMPVETGLR
jgi:hypothetical protein